MIDSHSNNWWWIDGFPGFLNVNEPRGNDERNVVWFRRLLFSLPSWVTKPFLGCCTISRLTTSLRAIMISTTVLS